MKPFNDTYVMYQLLEFIDESSIICLCKASKKLNEICKQYLELEDNKRFKIDRRLLEEYCSYNDVIKIKKLIKISKSYNWDYGLYGACQGGHIDIIRFMIEKGADDWNGGLNNACQSGHIDIVKLMIEKGANHPNWGLFHACIGGHIDTVQLIIKKGGNCWSWGLDGACRNGNMDIIKLMIEKGATQCGFSGRCNKSMEEHLSKK